MNQQQAKDIKEKIIRRKTELGSDVITECFYIPKTRTTIATIIVIPENYGKPIRSCHKRKLEAATRDVEILHGVALKRKGEKYSRDVGEIIALIDAR